MIRSGRQNRRQCGQISLGKDYAGRTVLMDEIEPGVWIIKTGAFTPDIDRAIAWAGKNPPADSDLDALEKNARQ